MSVISAIISMGFSHETTNSVIRWKTYHDTSCFANTVNNNEDKLILEACLLDEYSEMVADQNVMGVGLAAYNAFRRRFK